MIVRDDTSTTSGELLGGIGFDSRDGNIPSSILEASAYIGAVASETHTTGDKGGHLVFGTAPINQNDDVSSGEDMRLTDGGNLLIGRTSDLATTKDPVLEVDGTVAFDGFLARAGTSGLDNGANVMNLFWTTSGNPVGEIEIYVDTTKVKTLTSDLSDYRIKDNITPIQDDISVSYTHLRAHET